MRFKSYLNLLLSVKDKIQLILPEILSTLSVLGIEVFNNSFKTESTADERGDFPGPSEKQDIGDKTEAANEARNDATERMTEELEAADVGNSVKVETEDIVEAFEEVTVGNVFHNVESSKSFISTALWQNKEKVKDVQVKIPKLKIGKKRSVDNTTKEKRFSCDVDDCKSTFIHRGNLNKHIRSVHNKERPYQCGQCLKKFSDKNSVKWHILIVHDKEKPHQCDQCLKKFADKSHLRRHIEGVHENRKPFQCEHCSKKFNRKENMLVHIVLMHQEKSLACPHPEEKIGSCAGKNSD